MNVSGGQFFFCHFLSSLCYNGLRMKELLKFLKPYTKESILGPLFKLTEATFELFVPLVVASIVTDGIEKGNNAHILKML